MTTTDRRDATDAQFADELARLDRLDVADESAVERVARAIWESSHRDCHFSGCTFDGSDPDEYRRLARAAIDALKPAPGTDTSGRAVQRDECPHNEDRESCAVGCAAVAGPQRVETSCRHPLGCQAPGEGCDGPCPVTSTEARAIDAAYDAAQAARRLTGRTSSERHGD